jgi:hypothetical protein
MMAQGQAGGAERTSESLGRSSYPAISVINGQMRFGKEAPVSAQVVEVEGTLRPDGTLALDARVDLPPGRVLVTVQAAETRVDVMQVLQGIRADQAASGRVPRSREQIDADLAAMREEDDERMRDIERLHAASRSRENRGPASDEA